MFSYHPGAKPGDIEHQALDFMGKFGFDFVRLPMDYRFWIHDFNYSSPQLGVFDQIGSYQSELQSRELHLSLNVHRAPGYCINSPETEKHNLWVDAEAQDAFINIWVLFAKKFKGVPGKYLSFDLLNEPPSVGERGFTREIHEALMRRTVSAIREIDPSRPITLDGLDGGNTAMPELADLGVTHSTRGYQPMSVSHYQAGWWKYSQGLPPPEYPVDFDGKRWDRKGLEEFYKPWVAVEDAGVPVHVGEFGCYNKTPNEVALAWFRDLFGFYKSRNWGYSLWNFKGDFGIVSHGRPNTRYELIEGFEVDRELLQLMLDSRNE